MAPTWRLRFMLLTALQATASFASPVAVPEALRARDDTPPPSSAITASAKVVTSVAPSGTVQSLVSSKEPSTSGTVVTTLETTEPVPILTGEIPSPTSLLPTATTTASVQQKVAVAAVQMAAGDIFSAPIGTDAPPANIGRKSDHPVARKGITKNGPIETNKFYANFFLGEQTSPTFLHPYSVAWAKGKGASGSWGLAISHIDAKQRVYGPAKPGTGAAAYFINPIGIQSVVLSAKELGSGSALTVESPTDLSVQVSLRPNAQSNPAIQFPLVQGSAFITAIYNGATPMIQTGVFFNTVTRMTQSPKAGVVKYKFSMADGTTWLLYARHTQGNALDLQVVNNGLAQATGAFYGTIQVAKDPGNGEAVYDKACGTYPTGVTLSGSVSGATGTYGFSFKKAGMTDATLAMFALPHHQSSFDAATKGKMTDVKLQTTTKGIAAAVVADSWTMVESNLPTSVGFLPWSPQAGSLNALSGATKQSILRIAQQEMSQNMLEQSNLNSMYYSGKALAKFASIILATKEMLGDNTLAQGGLQQLKVAFDRFVRNAQQFPLVYESAWGGVVSSATYNTGDTGADFGNSLYNDHHFHYGYFIYAAAVIGHLDPSWLNAANRAYINMLVRDIANPSAQDTYFPVSRNFDWYHGHSWAHGLYDTLDGKNQESSSEDTMASYAIKMWGAVSGNANMEARGNLMLAIQARSLQSYYLYTSTNQVQPSNFIGNKVAGILFENKVDHTTFFGANNEYIQGIHMLPLLPHTPFIRTPQFVREEWETYFGNGRAASIVGGWKGIVYGNLATVDPRGAYDFFSQANFDASWIDGGASLTWYLCYSAALGGL